MASINSPVAELLWIGGPAAAGKSTVSRLLARRHGLRWYCVDAHTWQYADRATAAGDDPADRRTRILEDVRTLPATPLVIIEGAHLTPDFALPAHRALWLIPSAEEQRIRLARRHPEGVHDGYVRGHRLITEQLDGTGALVLHVDGHSIADTVRAIEKIFADTLHTCPRVRGMDDRRILIRYGNQIIADHATTGFARGALAGDAQSIIRTFDCECADPACTAFAELSLASVWEALAQPAPSVFAPACASMT